ncbi:ATP-binding protein [Kamptonema animale CS-326]|uniref:sensor histidine kinase n=1 Tax=Kamptonema animale TaxID=92934 RepID=UPI0023304CE9|nr:ATP-binding protein [Kamptonema animale]MDB9510349.1 ATP-binding protein [Kamptonema animale CS-326]
MSFSKVSQVHNNFQEEQRKKRKVTTLLLLAGFTLIVSAAAIASYLIIYELLLDTSKEKALLKVQQGSGEIDKWLETRKAEIATIADTPTLATMDWNVVEPYLKSQVKRIEEYQQLTMAFPDGSRFNTQVGKAKGSIADRPFFISAMAGKVTANDPVISRSLGVAQIQIGAPIGSPEKPLGTLSGAIPIDRLIKVVQSLQLGQGSYAFALNSQGRIIAHPDPSLRGTTEKPATSLLESKDLYLATLARRMVNKEQGIELIKVDGLWQYVAYTPLKQVNWSVALVIPRPIIESSLDALNILTLILGSVLIVAIIGGWRQVQLSEEAQANAKEKSQLYTQTQEQVELLNQSLVQQKQMENQLRQQTEYLEQTLMELRQIQGQLIQSEKMSSLGQLVAGIAHEVNNPAAFIYGNLSHVSQYTENLLDLVKLYQQHYPLPVLEIQAKSEEVDLEFLSEDLSKLLTSMHVGAERIRDIVKSLRNFSRLDESEVKAVNIHEGIDSTLMILQSRLNASPKYAGIEVIKEYGNLPEIECYAGQLNQVFMNILTNALDALEERHQGEEKIIRITTSLYRSDRVRISIADNGCGMTEEVKQRLFDPFFTTKPVGKGTGMGLSISYQIVTIEHRGRLYCISELGAGTEFLIEIPLHQKLETSN